MKANLFLSLLFISALTFSQGQPESFTITEDLSFIPVRDSVFLIVHRFPFGSNSLFVLMPDGKGLFVDTPNEESGMSDLLGWVKKTFGELNLIAINTGFHNDNLGGNSVLVENGIPVYGSGRTARLIENKKDELKTYLTEITKDLDNKKYYNSYSSVKFIPPSDTFSIDKGLELEFKDQTVEVYFPGESHTIDNTVVYFPKMKLLFGGCMILSSNRNKPGYIEDANMKEWPESVQKVLNKYPETFIVVPGHGLYGDKSLLKHTIAVLNRFTETKN